MQIIVIFFGLTSTQDPLHSWQSTICKLDFWQF